ncbi:MAG: GNAT family N-acetyltransferase [Planctomycetota bacterium]
MTHGTNASSPAYQWSRIAATDLDWWNRRLMQSDAAIQQLPCFAESLHQPCCRAIYVFCGPAQDPIAYACVRTMAGAPIKIGLVFRGPVLLSAAAPPRQILASLHAWAARDGYVFLRFSHWDTQLLDAVAEAAPDHERADAFPFLKDCDSELTVALTHDDASMLGRFSRLRAPQPERRTGDGLRGSRRGSGGRPRRGLAAVPQAASAQASPGAEARFVELHRRAAQHAGARVYTACLDQRPIQFILVIRAGITAEYWMGAIDLDALGGRASPGVLLHWRAMRDFAAMGCTRYNLGTRSGSVLRFKQKFRPSERHIAPVTVIIEPHLYRCWRWLALEVVAPIWPAVLPWLRAIVSR